MHSFSYPGSNTGPPLDRKPVWILLTALAFAIIGTVTVYSTTYVLPLDKLRSSVASDFAFLERQCGPSSGEMTCFFACRGTQCPPSLGVSTWAPAGFHSLPEFP